MISNQILQNTIEGLKAIARVDLSVMDTDGKEVAATADMAFRSTGVCSISCRFPGNSGLSVL